MPEPTRIPQAWAWNGDINTIPDLDPGNGLASWELGYPIETQTPIPAGGTPPRRQDMNGALNALSNGQLWYQQGGLWNYSATTDYEVGNHILQNGSLYYCIQANGPNSTVKSPSADTSEAYWKPIIYANGRHPDPDHLLAPAVLQVLQAVYPVGSIYCSYGNTSPATLFGFGSWTKIEGRFLLGANSTYGLGSTGGAATVTLTVNQIPSHTHTSSTASAGGHTHTASTASAGGHTHTASTASAGGHTHAASTASAGAHTHSVSGTAASAGAHTHTITVNSAGEHTHTASSNSAGAHTHTRGTMDITGEFFGERNNQGYVYGGAFYPKSNSWSSPGIEGTDWDNTQTMFQASRSWTGATSSNGAHSHTITINKSGAHTHSASSASAGAHTHSVSGTAASTGAHTHTVTIDSAGAHTHTMTVNTAGAHTHTMTVNTAGAHTHTMTVANTGGGQAHDNMPPYLAVNMWRRTA